MKTELNYIRGLDVCPVDDIACPYWDEKYRKCKMWNETNSRPADECGDYQDFMFEEEEKEEEE